MMKMSSPASGNDQQHIFNIMPYTQAANNQDAQLIDDRYRDWMPHMGEETTQPSQPVKKNVRDFSEP